MGSWGRRYTAGPGRSGGRREAMVEPGGKVKEKNANMGWRREKK